MAAVLGRAGRLSGGSQLTGRVEHVVSRLRFAWSCGAGSSDGQVRPEHPPAACCQVQRAVEWIHRHLLRAHQRDARRGARAPARAADCPGPSRLPASATGTGRGSVIWSARCATSAVSSLGRIGGDALGHGIACGGGGSTMDAGPRPHRPRPSCSSEPGRRAPRTAAPAAARSVSDVSSPRPSRARPTATSARRPMA